MPRNILDFTNDMRNNLLIVHKDTKGALPSNWQFPPYLINVADTNMRCKKISSVVGMVLKRSFVMLSRVVISCRSTHGGVETCV